VAQLARSAQDEDLAAQLVKRDLVGPALDLLAGDLTVATEVTNMAVALGENSAGLAALRGPFVPKQLLELMGRGSEIQLRVLELVVRVAVLGEDQLVAMTTATLLKPLLDLVQTDDCLAALSAIELLVTLALPPHGQKFLESTGVLARMARLLDDGQNHPFASILVPGLVKFFGNLAHTRPRQVMMEYPAFVSSLAAMAESEDPVAQAIALETVGYIGVSLEGKLALAELGNRMTDTIDRLELLITDSPTEARIRAMNAFASLIKLDKENQVRGFISIRFPLCCESRALSFCP
jgi:26S proteasome non-ATPase regulatory subunit 5